MVLHNSKYDKQAKMAHWVKKAKKSGKSVKEVMNEDRAMRDGKNKSKMPLKDIGDNEEGQEDEANEEDEFSLEHVEAGESGQSTAELDAQQDQDQGVDYRQSLFPEDDDLELPGEKERQREYLELAKEAARLRIEQDESSGKNMSEHVVRLEDRGEFDQLRSAIDRSKSLAHFKRRFGSSKSKSYQEDDFDDFLDEIDAGDAGQRSNPVYTEPASQLKDSDGLQDLLGEEFGEDGNALEEHEKELEESRRKQQYIDELLGL